MRNFDLDSIGVPRKSIIRLERLREIGILHLSPKEKREAADLLDDARSRFKAAFFAAVSTDHDVTSDLAHKISFAAPNIYAFKNKTDRITDRFIGHISQYDPRYRHAWPAWRAITDWFYLGYAEEEGPVESSPAAQEEFIVLLEHLAKAQEMIRALGGKNV